MTHLPILQFIDFSSDEAECDFNNETTCLDCNCFNNTSVLLPLTPHTIPIDNGTEIHPSKLHENIPGNSSIN